MKTTTDDVREIMPTCVVNIRAKTTVKICMCVDNKTFSYLYCMYTCMYAYVCNFFTIGYLGRYPNPPGIKTTSLLLLPHSDILQGRL